MNAQVSTAIGSNGTGVAKETVGSPLEELFDGVDDLIRRVADTENPEIRKIRAKVYAALAAAKSAFAAKSARSADDPLRDHPGPALGVALLVGLGLGLV